MVATDVVPEVYVNVPPDKLDVGAVKVKLELPYAFVISPKFESTGLPLLITKLCEA